jgi:hypothetical protein
MIHLVRYLAAGGAALMLTVSPALAAEQAATSSEPVELTDHELDQVAAGDGSLLDLNLFVNVMLKNIAVTFNVSNVPINAGVAVQANALGTAAQTATVQALQEVTQVQSLPTFP